MGRVPGNDLPKKRRQREALELEAYKLRHDEVREQTLLRRMPVKEEKEEEEAVDSEREAFKLQDLEVEILLQKKPVGGKNEEAVESEGSNNATSNGSSKIMNGEILCALRACDKEALINTISNDKNVIQQHVDDQGNSILHFAASLGDVPIVRYIASTFADLLKKRNSMGETAYHVAARSGNLNVVEYLVECTTDGSLILATNKSKNGDTALHAALKGKHADVALYLLGLGQDVSFVENGDKVSPLYLAVEAGYYEVVKKMLESSACPAKSATMLSEKSLVHAAMRAKRTDILAIVLHQDPRLLELREEGRTCLSFGASIGFYEGICYILTNLGQPALDLCYFSDVDGFTPIHMAAKEGHLRIIMEILKHCPNSIQSLNNRSQNILHVAAENGKSDVVKYILGLDKKKRIMNEQDIEGNTPLHLATQNWHPKIVSMLTWDDGVDLKTLNKSAFTALDIAEKLETDDYILRRRLTWMALVSAGAPNAPRSIPLSISRGSSKCEYTEKFKDRVNTLLVVATLVATVTFAAGFTLPGGYTSSAPDLGMAVLVKKTAFKVFLLCDSIAMLSSMVSIMALIWAQLGDVVLTDKAFRVALPLLATSLVAMSVAFMAGVCLVISHRPWLAYSILVMDSVFLLALVLLIIPYIFSYTRQGFLRRIFYIPYSVMLLAVSDD